MRFERGDLLLIPFPFTDLSSTKRRPVLALTGPGVRGDFVGLPVTSRPQGDAGLAVTAESLRSGSLPRPSWIKTDHPVTLHAGLVVQTVAQLEPEVTREAIRRLCVLLSDQLASPT